MGDPRNCAPKKMNTKVITIAVAMMAYVSGDCEVCGVACPVSCFEAISAGGCPENLGQAQTKAGAACASYFQGLEGSDNSKKNKVWKTLAAACAKAGSSDCIANGNCGAGIADGCPENAGEEQKLLQETKQKADDLLNLLAETDEGKGKAEVQGFSCW